MGIHGRNYGCRLRDGLKRGLAYPKGVLIAEIVIPSLRLAKNRLLVLIAKKARSTPVTLDAACTANVVEGLVAVVRALPVQCA